MKNLPWYRYLIIALLIFLTFFFLYFKPKNSELKNVRAERITVEDEVINLQAKKQQLDKIETELESMDKTLKELELIIPQKKEISDILRKIQQLAFDSRLNIIKFAPKGEINKEFYSEWPISIEITGNYYNLGRFLNLISHFSRLFNIESFLIKSLQKQTDDLTISATCIAKTYIFHEESLNLSPPKKEVEKKK